MDLLPQVTVIVPCYNHEAFIKECIESIVNQTYKNIDLVVIDDGSVDRSAAILSELQLLYGFTVVLQKNIGLAATLNRGIREYGHGKYLTFCASDDYWSLDKIQKQVDFMEKNQFYPMVYGKTHYVDEGSLVLQEYDKNNSTLRGGFLFEDIFLFRLHPPVNYLFRTDLFKEVGFYDESIFAEDYYMNLKISSKYPIGFIDDYISYYRHTDTTFKIARFDMVADSHLMSIEKYQGHPLYQKAKSMVFLRKFELFSGFKKHKKLAIQNLFKALPLIYDRRFIISCIRLVVFWK